MKATPLRLLVVDDDKVFCERLARAMSSRGFTARTALSVTEAIAAIETSPPAFAANAALSGLHPHARPL